MDAGHLDRQEVETLVGVGSRRARQLMTGLAGIRVGNAVAVSRLALLERMEAAARPPPISGKWPAVRRVRIPAAPDLSRRRFGDLPAAISLTPGALKIEFRGAEDLAAKLLELSQAMANDWSAFMRAVKEP